MNDQIVDQAVRETLQPRSVGTAYQGNWATVMARKPEVSRRQRLARIAYPVAAAAVVLGVIVGAATLWSPGGGGLRFASPTDNATKEHHPPMDPPMADAGIALHFLAGTISSTVATPIAAGQYLYVHFDGWGNTYTVNAGTAAPAPVREQQDRQIWFRVDGLVPARFVMDGQETPVSPPPTNSISTDRYASAITSSALPFPQWLASLPADPMALATLLRADTDQTMTWSDDWQVFGRLTSLLSYADVIMSGPQRASVYGAIGLLTGISTSTATIDGRSLVVIRHTEKYDGQVLSIDELLFDPATGYAVGARGVNAETGVLDWQTQWTQAVVDTTTETS